MVQPSLFNMWLTVAARLSFSATPKECARAFRTSCIAKAVFCKLVPKFAIERQRKEDWGSEEESMAESMVLVETRGSNWTPQQDSLPTKFALCRSSLHIHSWWQGPLRRASLDSLASWTVMKWIKMDCDGFSVLVDVSGSFGIFSHQLGRTRGSVKRLSMVWKVDDSRSVLWSKTGVSLLSKPE